MDLYSFIAINQDHFWSINLLEISDYVIENVTKGTFVLINVWLSAKCEKKNSFQKLRLAMQR